MIEIGSGNWIVDNLNSALGTWNYLNTLSPDAALRYYDLLTEQIASLSHLHP